MTRRGHLFKRCGRCNTKIPADRRSCQKCDYRSFSWAFVIDVAPPGAQRERCHRQGFATKADALDALSDLQNDVRDGRAIKASKKTLGEYLDTWLDSIRPPTVRPGTWDSYRLHVETYISPRIGDVPMWALDPTTIKKLYVDLRENGRKRGEGGLSAKSVHNVHITLRRALETATEDRLIPRNPASKAHRAPKSGAEETPAWNADELRAFLGVVAEDRLFALWRVAGHSGARRGELLALRWSDIDLDGATVAINRNRVKGRGGRVTEDRPKTPRGRRTIDLDPQTIETLRDHRKAQLEERLAYGEGYGDGDYVFCRPDGEPLHPDTVSQAFDRLVARSGLRRVTMHGLRHSHGSILLRAGVPLHVVSRRLGHASEAFTAQVYAHVLPGQQAEAAAAFAAAVDESL